MAGTRTIIGSETDDTKHVELDRLGGTKVTVPISIYDGNGNQVTSFAGNPFTSITNGRLSISTPGTAVALPNVPCKQVIITPVTSNAGLIYVGGIGTRATTGSESGVVLTSLGSVTFNVSSLSAVFVDGTNINDSITYIYLS